MWNNYAARLFALAVVSLIAWGQPVSQSSPRSIAALTVDGKLDDAFWQSVRAHTLRPSETGVPEDEGGRVYFGLRGTYLCLAARLPEAGGKVLARSLGHNPEWETHHPEAPPVEDRIEFQFRYKAAGGGERNAQITINPWGAYRLEQTVRPSTASDP